MTEGMLENLTGAGPVNSSRYNSQFWFLTLIQDLLYIVFFKNSFLYILNFGYFRFRYDLFYVHLHIIL